MLKTLSNLGMKNSISRPLTLDTAAEIVNQEIRDNLDINRKHSPLRISKDSIVIDTSKLSKKQTLDKISNIVEKKLLLKYGRNFKTK